jgi:hypothetical protein
MQTLSKKTQEHLATLIAQATLFGHTHNDLDLYRSALAIKLLADLYGIRVPALQRAKETLIILNQLQTQEA